MEKESAIRTPLLHPGTPASGPPAPPVQRELTRTWQEGQRERGGGEAAQGTRWTTAKSRRIGDGDLDRTCGERKGSVAARHGLRHRARISSSPKETTPGMDKRRGSIASTGIQSCLDADASVSTKAPQHRMPEGPSPREFQFHQGGGVVHSFSPPTTSRWPQASPGLDGKIRALPLPKAPQRNPRTD